MADEKYGKLFTESDVQMLVATALATLTEPDDPGDVDVAALVASVEGEGFPLRFPADEPLFLLRGKDEAAFETLVKYIEVCEGLGASDEFVRAAEHSVGKLLAWQKINESSVKVAD